MAEHDEPMAIVHWRFESKAWPGLTINGSHECRERREAQAIAEQMNAEYGDGSHWVETLNQSYAERYDVPSPQPLRVVGEVKQP